MNNVTLREITADTVRAVVKLAVHPDQAGFVATNAVSLSQALFSDEAWYTVFIPWTCPWQLWQVTPAFTWRMWGNCT